MRYDQTHFPKDLQIQELPDTEPFRMRYVMQIAWKGKDLSTWLKRSVGWVALRDPSIGVGPEAMGREGRPILRRRYKPQKWGGIALILTHMGLLPTTRLSAVDFVG